MKHPQHDNLIIAAKDKDALFECKEIGKPSNINFVMTFPEYTWTHVKASYKYQHVKDAWEKDKSLVVQVRDSRYRPNWIPTNNPEWDVDLEYRIKPKTITKRLYADKHGGVWFFESPSDGYTIPINGTETEVECE